MNGPTPIDDQLLAKYIAGEADAAERWRVEQWAASEANARELERMRAVWNWSGEGTIPAFDVDAAWQRVSARVDGAGERGRVIPMRTWNARRWIAAAAAVAVIVLVARWWARPENNYTIGAGAAFKQAELADGTKVDLSPGTFIDVHLGDERKVVLAGEAYFEVAKDAEHPFVITAGQVQVTVLGTAFSVRSMALSDSVLVRVREGRVQVVASDDTLVLGAGEHAIYQRSRNFLERAVAPPAELWGDRIIQFEEAPLPAVIAQLQVLFPVRIQLGNPAMARCTLTATFEDEPIDRILDVVAQTYGITVEHANNTYTLQGDGCE